jgi:cell division protein FtsB
MSGRAAALEGPRGRLTPRAAVLAALVLILLLTAIVPLRGYLTQRSRLVELEQQVERLATERDRLERRVGRLRDPAYLERLARECLGMVRPGEIAFVTVPEGGEPQPIRC